jgi:hypothetical protein
MRATECREIANQTWPRMRGELNKEGDEAGIFEFWDTPRGGAPAAAPARLPKRVSGVTTLISN